ncbi:unnamed protein product [Urochloa humidicola]
MGGHSSVDEATRSQEQGHEGLPAVKKLNRTAAAGLRHPGHLPCLRLPHHAWPISPTMLNLMVAWLVHKIC